MNYYALYIWEESGDTFIYHLGTRETLDDAEGRARSILNSFHNELDQGDNLCWRVGPFRSLKHRALCLD